MERADRVRDRLQEEILRGRLLIDTAGSRAGQVNGLSVAQLGGFSFGIPHRITARVRLGAGKVVDIEREVELAIEEAHLEQLDVGEFEDGSNIVHLASEQHRGVQERVDP